MSHVTTLASRRALLRGILAAAAVPVPALAVALSKPAAAAIPAVETAPPAPTVSLHSDRPFPDKGLMELVEQYLKLEAEREKFDKITSLINAKWEAKHPMPDALRARPGDAELCLPHLCSEEVLNRCGWMVGNIEDMRRPEWWRTVVLDPPEGLKYARGGEGLESYVPSPEARARADEIVAAYDEWFPKRDAPGSRKRGAQSERLFNKLSRLEAKINKRRARTFVGLLAKGYIASITASDPDSDPAIESLLRDCRAHAELYVPCIAVPKAQRDIALRTAEAAG
jgi:hypothetical protein